MERQDRVSDTISHRIRQNTRRWKLLERQLRPHGRCLSLSPMSPGLRARGTNATWWITTASITMPQLFSDRIRSRIPTSLETPKYSVVAAALVVSTCHGRVHDSTRHSKTTCSCSTPQITASDVHSDCKYEVSRRNSVVVTCNTIFAQTL